MVSGLLRQHHGGHAPVSNLELFFDLVYVFAITQISLFLRDHLSLPGLIEAGILFLAVWWAWIYTTWATNWANPDTVPVRLMIVAMMLGSLVLAAVLPRAFDGGASARWFALTYCLIQIGRTAFMVWAMARENPAGARNMARVLCWFIASVPFWLIGAHADAPMHQAAWWAVALGIEYAGPFAFFRVPGLGRSSGGDWDISGSHMAERASLFVLIALGEGVVVSGSAFAAQRGGTAGTLAFAACFAESVLMWWIYFDTGADRGADAIAHSEEAGRIARNAYTYLHMPIVAAIVATAVGDATLMAAPDAMASPALITVTGGGLLVFLTGLALFKRFSSPLGNLPLSHNVGVVLLTTLIITSRRSAIPAVSFVALACAVLAIVAIWEWGSLHGGWRERLARVGIDLPARRRRSR